ncbi:hypothetical protein [Erythrobacter sp. MTPC3]|uniref:hypothetical protein n=1 Tax=Erythrobacter sp. MTPC3 TaxID=3056564 RepID=UPI0036F21EE6
MSAGAIAAMAFSVPSYGQSVAVDTNSEMGLYSELDPRISEVAEVNIEATIANWRLEATVETHTSDEFGFAPHNDLPTGGFLNEFGQDHFRSSQLERLEVSLSRYESIADGLWVSATAGLTFATERVFRDYYSEIGSFEAGLLYSHEDTFYWVDQRREFIQSDRFATRHTWHSQAGFSRRLRDGDQIGVMISRTQYPFDSWGTSTALSIFGTQNSAFGPIKGWLAAQQFGERQGVSAALAFEQEF